MAGRQDLVGPAHVPDESLNVGDDALVSNTSDAVFPCAPAVVW